MSTYFRAGHFLAWCPGEDETEADAKRFDIADDAVLHALAVAKSWLRERNDEGQWTDDSDGVLVHVRDPDGKVTRWDVRAELTIKYTAREAS